MKLPKKPLDPRLKHYSVVIDVRERFDETAGITSVKSIAATSMEQAVRRAGMQLVQELARNAHKVQDGSSASRADDVDDRSSTTRRQSAGPQ